MNLSVSMNLSMNLSMYCIGMVDAGLAAAKKLAQAQLGGKSSGGGGGSNNANAGPGEGKHVVELTETNFKKKVLDSDKVSKSKRDFIIEKQIAQHFLQYRKCLSKPLSLLCSSND